MKSLYSFDGTKEMYVVNARLSMAVMLCVFVVLYNFFNVRAAGNFTVGGTWRDKGELCKVL